MTYKEDLHMDDMIEYERISKLLEARKVTKHIYVFDIYALKLISPDKWKDGAIMKCLGYGEYLEDDDIMVSSLCNIIMERCIEIVLSESSFNHYLEDPITLKEELIYYLNETHKLTSMYSNQELMEYEGDLIREYLHYFSKYLGKITNGLLDRKYNVIDVALNQSSKLVENGSFCITSCVIDISGNISSILIAEKFYNIPALP